MTFYWIDKDGVQLLATSDPKATPEGAIEAIETAPESGRQRWLGDRWSEAPSELDRLDREIDSNKLILGLVRLIASQRNTSEAQIRLQLLAKIRDGKAASRPEK